MWDETKQVWQYLTCLGVFEKSSEVLQISEYINIAMTYTLPDFQMTSKSKQMFNNHALKNVLSKGYLTCLTGWPPHWPVHKSKLPSTAQTLVAVVNFPLCLLDIKLLIYMSTTSKADSMPVTQHILPNSRKCTGSWGQSTPYLHIIMSMVLFCEERTERCSCLKLVFS